MRIVQVFETRCAFDTGPVHFLQIWIASASNGMKSSFDQIHFAQERKQRKLERRAGTQGGNGVATITQNVKVVVAELPKGAHISCDLGTNYYVWLHVVRGSASVNDAALKTGDTDAFSAEKSISVVARACFKIGVR